VDGRFPNHQPDPSQPENLETLRGWVGETQADLGLAFDGDGDRLGVVDGEGNIIWPDRQLMLLARDVLSRNPGAPIIFDVKCSRHLRAVIEQAGGQPVMWRTGHSLIKSKMKELDAPLAGEMSGHIFFKERWYGFDDALYTAARLLEVLMKEKRKPAEVFAELPQGVSTPELRVPMPESEHAVFMGNLSQLLHFDGAQLIDIDGYRVEFADGWGLVRPSNTSPALVLRFEADSEAALQRIEGQFRDALLTVKPELKLPF
jgi:phosphomannomutase/phosphoglucomutase